MTEYERDLIVAALRYIDRKWRIIPASPDAGQPSIDRWWEIATSSKEQVTAWWTGEYRGWNIGIVTGERSGLLVLEIDLSEEKNKENFSSLESKLGKLPGTYSVEIPGGGRYSYFRYPESGRLGSHAGESALGPGIKVWAEGELVPGPPSLHSNGEKHTIIDEYFQVEVSQLPEPWLDMLLSAEKGGSSK